jgi:hypothetical protein
MPTPDNPFRPAPGSEPPALVGRDAERSAAQYALHLTRSGAPAQPIVFIGLRGMGKTALLRRCIADAEADGAVVIYGEATHDEPLGTTLFAGLQRARRANATLGEKLHAGFDAIVESLPTPSFNLPGEVGSISLERGNEREEKIPDNFDTLDELNELIRRNKRYLVFAIDEVQEAPIAGLRDLVRFVHRTAGLDVPVYLLAAGLPNSREHLHEVRTYTERWRYFRLDLLNPDDTRAAIEIPSRQRDVTIAPEALNLLASESAGYPFFVQEYASAAWLAHKGRTITHADVAGVVPGVRRVLEDDFYDSRFRLLTPRECAYVLAMARLGPGPHTTGEIASVFGSKSEILSSIRNRLVKKDVVYSPASGMIEFRIPLTERYVLAHQDELERRAADSKLREGEV